MFENVYHGEIILTKASLIFYMFRVLELDWEEFKCWLYMGVLIGIAIWATATQVAKQIEMLSVLGQRVFDTGEFP
jgi:hypothetical protein